jgi:hypothetical protein
VVKGSVPAYTESPVFYTQFQGYYGDESNLDAVHEGKLNIGVMGTVPIDSFIWSGGGHDASYWAALEMFRYLDPLVASGRPADQDFVREWIRGWLDAHAPESTSPNLAADDQMSVGTRAMVFIWYLRELHERGESDGEWAALVKQRLLRDQADLKDSYDTLSNHGFWGAMGLFETTRVHPDSSLARLALDRLLEMVDLSVSERGLHMEHSPAYHFDVWNWLRQFTTYLGSLNGIEWSGYPALVDAERRMRDAMYYFYDHERNVPQIGDTDARTFEKKELPSDMTGRRDDVMYDEQAGYAIYKDRLGRYLVFCIQNQAYEISMPYHYHDDVLAVYYSHGGEIILGDPGRHSYGRGTPIRKHLISNAAHNTVVSTLSLGRRGEVERAQKVSWEREEDRDLFLGKLADGRITREVEIPRRSTWVGVTDTIVGRGRYTILWHMGPDVVDVLPSPSPSDTLSATYAWRLTTRSRRKLELKVAIYSDASEPPQIQLVPGWYSPAQHVQLPATVMRIDLVVREWAHVTTTVRPDGF